MPVAGPGHAWPHAPQLAMDDGSTQLPPQSSDVGAMHPRPHTPLVHVA